MFTNKNEMVPLLGMQWMDSNRSNLQLKNCVIETSCWQGGGPTNIGDPISATRVGVGIKNN